MNCENQRKVYIFGIPVLSVLSKTFCLFVDMENQKYISYQAFYLTDANEHSPVERKDVEGKRKLITKENQVYIVKRSSPDYIEE